jgi:hypothetical protein
VATPVSSTAIAVPAPVLPAAVGAVPPMRGMLWSSDGRAGMSSVTLTTLLWAASFSRPAWSTLTVTSGRVRKVCTVLPVSAAADRSARCLVRTLTRTFLPFAVLS